MALGSRTAHAMAQQLAALTGETPNDAVANALKERLDRLSAGADDDVARRILLVGADICKKYDVRQPITPKDWDDL